MKSPSNDIPSDLAFTASVKAVQERMGSRKSYAHMERESGWENKVTAELGDFIGGLDSFYLGTASADGRPYIQHRGGPKGFLKVLDERTLAFADFGGNRQYISIGNLAENDKAFLFLIDHETRRRVKVWGRAVVIENDTELLARLSDPSYGARAERVFRFHVETWDANCPQHIPRRLREETVASLIAGLRQRIARLEAELNDRMHAPKDRTARGCEPADVL